MKKVISFIIFILLCPIFLDALSYKDYDSSIETVNYYISNYNDRNKYLIFEQNYDFREGTSKKHNSFIYGGLLSKQEYELSVIEDTSYLANGKEYWTLTESGANQWYVDATIGLKNRGESSGVRVSEFTKNDVKVKGKGTYENPWVFLNSYSINVRPESSSRGEINPTSQTVVDGQDSKNILVTEKDGYMYSSNDCGLTKMGYTADNKVILKKNNVKQDYSCIVSFVRSLVNVSYDCNGGTGSTASQTFEYNKSYTLNNSGCAKTGNTQTGWTTSDGNTWELNESGTWTYGNGQRGVDHNNLNLKAVWEANKYTATFHYNSNTTSGSFTDATTTATCTVTSGSSCTVTVPSVVTSSVGKYNSTYKGVSTSTGSMASSSLSITGNTTFYANYSSALTIYYPNTSNGVSNSATALYRNEYYSSASAMTTITSTANNNTTQATTVTLSNIKGSFQGLNAANTTTKLGGVNASAIVNSNATTYYAITTESENVTFKYNNNTTCGSATIASATQAVTTTYYCSSTTTMGTNHGTTTTVPSVVSSSKGQYNSTYRGVAAVNSLTAVTTFTGGTTYYAVYSQSVTNYYYGSSYTSRTLYRNEYLASASATTYTVRLATSNTGTSNYSTATGPGSSVWSGLSTAQDTTAEYSTVAAAATSCSNTLYTVYTFNVTYAKGSNVNAIGATSGSCKITTSSTSCNVTLPSITANSGYTAVGWSTTNGATRGTAAGSNYTLSTNATTLYANAQQPILMSSNGDENSDFLRTNVIRKDIEKITFTNSTSGHTVNGTDCFDASRDENKSVLAWVTDTNNNGKKEITIGGTTKVYASSGYGLFSDLINLKTIDGMQYFDTSKVTIMRSMFSNCNELTSLNLSYFDTSKVTDMSSMFLQTYKLTTLNLSSFNTSRVTDMHNMFSGCYATTLTGFTNFDTSKVTDMSRMFFTSNVTSLNLSSFDTSKVTNMSYMFSRCWNLTSLDLSNFNTSNVTNMAGMFEWAKILTSLNISSFDTSKVTSMSYMFSQTPFNIIDISSFNTLNVTNMSYMFDTCQSLRTITVSNSFVTTSVTNSINMFNYDTKLVGEKGTVFNSSHVDKGYAHIDGGTSNPGYLSRLGGTLMVDIKTSETDTALSTNIKRNEVEAITFVDSISGHTVNGTDCFDVSLFSNGTVLAWVTDTDNNGLKEITIGANGIIKASSLNRMFMGYSNLTSINSFQHLNTSEVTDMDSMFYGCKKLTSLDLSSFDTSNVTNTSDMFGWNEKLTSLDLSSFDTSNVTDMSGMFYGCKLLTSLNLSSFNTSKVTDMNSMFAHNEKITSLDITNFDTSNVTSMGYWLYNCKSLIYITFGAKFNTSNVTNMSLMFSGCSSITSIDVSKLNTTNVTTMQDMFENCSSLTSLNLNYSTFNTSKVTNMAGMFYGLKNLTSLNVKLSNFNTSNVTGMSSMFGGCEKLTSLDLSGSNFNTSKVTRMAYMFENCSSLTSLNLNYSTFNTSKVTSMKNMFSGCKGLTSLNISGFNTSNVTDMSSMFYGCSNLTSLNIVSFNTSKVTSMSYMFYNCSKLTTLDLSSFNTSNLTNMTGIFYASSRVQTIYASNNFVTTNVETSSNAFYACSQLRGGNGTEYNRNYIDKTYARIDASGTPGYFTYKAAPANIGSGVPNVYATMSSQITGGANAIETLVYDTIRNEN